MHRTTQICSILPLLLVSMIGDSSSELGGEQEEGSYEDGSPEESLGEVLVIEEVVYGNTSSTTPPPIVDHSDDEWVKDAVLDVAYYLRAHKFNDYDRRYFADPKDKAAFQYQQFPDPPLRYLHWEVYKYCDRDFYECLAYLQDTALKARLIRSLDTNVVMNERHWEYTRDQKAIDKLDKECIRLKEIDWRDADPFKGPLERFQWRVSASYYMCAFTMQNYTPLIMFGERCDNFANCLQDKKSSNGDPRGDDSQPYQCALYSFCPNPCCPRRFVEDEKYCWNYRKNPCYWQSDPSKRKCTFGREENRDMTAMALNQWNVSCVCDPGYEWESMFGACVDIDECSTGTHTCDRKVQTCVNLKGQYGCICTWGYKNVSGSCVPNDVLTRALDGLYQHYHPPTEGPPKPFTLTTFMYNCMTKLLQFISDYDKKHYHLLKHEEKEKESKIQFEDSDKQFDLNPE